ncbi:uncharacterized protein SPAPADRAFT_144617 [Spathaspora passalidarum NRRL Y-27907]|uniref:XLF-like N-terminal domain-containing protein n=1 Tax=Spathaspora passalidarum (strain NRRL Y-27907 / 11-Y1) TaxID=619300 RepID=G3AV21_SPAPN|nr:uncharacterized protein SPAPADRAFT_144617 [Spathaspora passalidarum NRRL Y-27907]EGW30095.1 hypothetical protein SPAPADRAFT_144617 [Spathaspora passalidarum NRRL Y-27907]
MLLPKLWKSCNLPFLESPCIYGFSIADGYGFYLTDFTSLWNQRLNQDELIAVAAENGLEDVTNECMANLLCALEESVSNKDNLSFTQADNVIECKLTGEFNWTFTLTKRSPEQTVTFLSQLNYQQFSNNVYLTHQINNLQKIIAVKDTFIKFLTENFKQTHGLDLINKYKRMNKQDIEAIEQFNKIRWSKASAIEYRKVRTSKKRSEMEELSKNINEAIGNSWKFANSFYTNEEELEEQLSPIKIHPDLSPIKSSSPPPPGAKKKLKFGALGVKPSLPKPHTPVAPTGATPTPSPRKKKQKIGSLH